MTGALRSFDDLYATQLTIANRESALPVSPTSGRSLAMR